MSSFWPMLRASVTALADRMMRKGLALLRALPTPPRAPVAIPIAVRLRPPRRWPFWHPTFAQRRPGRPAHAHGLSSMAMSGSGGC